MKITENAMNVMAAMAFKGVGRGWVAKNLEVSRTPCEIVALLNLRSRVGEKVTIEGSLDRRGEGGGKVTIEEFEREKAKINAMLAESSDSIDGVVALGDDEFPAYRGIVRRIGEKPAFLFYRGDLSLLGEESRNVAVIGERNPDAETMADERSLVAELVDRGAVIVSGLALGCDTVAHRQALASSGRTIAILPSPLSDVVPAGNRDLAREIAACGGLLISEYLTAAGSKKAFNGRYQERDRLQAMYSNAVVLCASYAKNGDGKDSGARLAMGYAKEYGIPRVAMFDRARHGGNPKYGLNQALAEEDPDVFVVDQKSRSLAAEKILRMRPKAGSCGPVQQSLI